MTVFKELNSGVDEFSMGKVTPLKSGINKWHQDTNVANPASVPAPAGQKISGKAFGTMDNGPWSIDAAKKGNPGAMKDWGKLNKQADDHKGIVDAAK